jgi:hypothetical protein
MTFERSHGRSRLTRPRLREVSPSSADGDRPGDRDSLGRFVSGNRAGTAKAAKHALTAPLRAAVAAGVAEAVPGEVAPETRAQVAHAALTLYRAAKRELGPRSTIVLSHLVRWAIGTAVSQHLSLAAAQCGLDTDRGARLLELAHTAEGRAERASVAALTMARALKSSRDDTPPPWLEADEGEES